MITLDYEVVVPAWNAEATLADTLDSLTGQQPAPRRITVADDGSTDATAEIAARYGVNLLSAPHLGLAGVQDRALQTVDAPFVAFVDSDDVWRPSAAAEYASFWAGAEANTAACSFDAQRFSGDLSAVSGIPGPVSFAKVEPLAMWAENVLVKSATMFRTAAIRSVGGYRQLASSEDYDLALRLMAAGFDLAKSDSKQLLLRVRPGSMTSKVDVMLRSHTDALGNFYRSSFRQHNLPRASLNRRLRIIWLRTLAMAAHYDVPLASVPTLGEISNELRDIPLIPTLIRNPIASRALGRGYVCVDTLRRRFVVR